MTKFSIEELFNWLDQLAADSTLPASSLRVGLYLAHKINKEKGFAWPSLVSIAEGISAKKPAALRGIKGLVAAGHLKVENSKIGHGAVNKYYPVMQAKKGIAGDTLSDDKKGTMGDTHNNQKGIVGNTHFDGKRVPPVIKKGTMGDTRTVYNSSIGVYNPQTPTAVEGTKQSCVGGSKSLSSPNIQDGFEQFWVVYPRHDEKGAAKRAFEGIIKSGDVLLDDLISGAARYAAAEKIKGQPQFTRFAKNWLRDQGWLDEPATLAPSQNQMRRGRRSAMTMALEASRAELADSHE